MSTSAYAVAYSTRPAKRDLAKHARSLWVGKRIASQGRAFEITWVTITQNGLEIDATDVVTGQRRGFLASKVAASSIYSV